MNSNANGNLAFIDGSNTHRGISDNLWSLDYTRFRVFLRDKYSVRKAYYFPGYFDAEYKNLYAALKGAGFSMAFKPHRRNHLSDKKGNADALMVFYIMRILSETPNAFNKIILVTGDGDFYNLVKFLVEEGRLEKVLHPIKENASSLYKSLGSEYYDFLGNPAIRSKIERREDGRQ